VVTQEPSRHPDRLLVPLNQAGRENRGTALFPAIAVVRYRRLVAADQRTQPEWAAEWKRADRAKKRRIQRALRRGETLYDPDDARLLVGLSQRIDRLQGAGGWWRRIEWPILAVSSIVGVITGDVRLAVQAIVILGSVAFLHRVVLPRQRKRRHQTALANNQIHGRS
jgi:hypothetical protein